MGLLLTTDGGEYTGKTTLNTILKPVLIRSGFDVRLSREPGGTQDGESHRSLMRSRLEHGATPREMALHMSAARRGHIDDVVIPFLGSNREQRRIMMLDRFADSTTVYQGLEGGVALDDIRDLHRFTLRGWWPDLTILLHIPESKFQTTFRARKLIADEMREGSPDLNAWDNVDTKTHIERQRHYFSLPKLYESWGIPRNVVFIDSSQSPLDVAKEALREINPYLASIEIKQRDGVTRRRFLMNELQKYHDEGNMDDVENRWRRQINLESELSHKGKETG